MNINLLVNQIKQHPEYHKVGMILCHNGVVRGTSRDGRPVRGLRVTVDQKKLTQIINQQIVRPGIIDIRVHIHADRNLSVGDDVMALVVAGDIRDNVIAVLSDTLNAIKSTVTSKTQFFS